MIRSVDYSLENSDKELIVCQQCSNPLTSAKDADVYLKVAYQDQPAAYYFLSKMWPIAYMDNKQFYSNEFDYHLGAVPPFLLMQLCKVSCGKCHTKVGLFVRSSNGEETDWLKERVLFDEQSVEFQCSSRIGLRLNQTLKESLEYQQGGKKQTMPERRETTQSMISNILRDIAFYSGTLEELKKRSQEVAVLCKYSLAKSRSEKKRNSSRY